MENVQLQTSLICFLLPFQVQLTMLNNGEARIRILWMQMTLTLPTIHLVFLKSTKNKYGNHQMALAKSQTVNNTCLFTFQRRAGPFGNLSSMES